MMAGTIRENLSYGLSNAKVLPMNVMESCEMAYADQFIKTFPKD